MSLARKRVWRVIVGLADARKATGDIRAIDVSNLDCSWSITKNAKTDPNTCALKIFNLPEDYRRTLEALSLWDPIKSKDKDKKNRKAAGAPPCDTGTSTVPAKTVATDDGCPQPSASKTKKAETNAPKPGRILTEIYAGYDDTGLGLVWRGELHQSITTREDDGTWVTEIKGEDGGHAMLGSRSRRTYPRGTSLYTVVRDCAGSMGVGVGNIADVEAVLKQRRFQRATTLDGHSASELDGILSRARIAYSIQDNNIQFSLAGRGLTKAAFELSASSGLIGTPSHNANGRVQAKMLLNAQVGIGSQVAIRARQLSGTYQVVEQTISCDTRGEEWYAELLLV